MRMFLRVCACVAGILLLGSYLNASERQYRVFLYSERSLRELSDIVLHYNGRSVSSKSLSNELFIVRAVGPAAELSCVTKDTIIEVGRYDGSVPFRPIPVGTPVMLQHGDQLRVNKRIYMVYVEEYDQMFVTSNIAEVLSPETRSAISNMDTKQLVEAATCFLHLPFALRSWLPEFKSKTGFLQARDGRVPRARIVEIAVHQEYVHVVWEVTIWDMASEEWLEDREKAQFEWDFRGRDLDTFVECPALFDFRTVR